MGFKSFMAKAATPWKSRFRSRDQYYQQKAPNQPLPQTPESKFGSGRKPGDPA
jgi:hypothetical protein